MVAEQSAALRIDILIAIHIKILLNKYFICPHASGCIANELKRGKHLENGSENALQPERMHFMRWPTMSSKQKENFGALEGPDDISSQFANYGINNIGERNETH